MKVKLAEKQIRHVIKQYQKRRSTADIAVELKVTPRCIQQLCTEFRKTGMPHTQRNPRRKRIMPASEETQMVLDEHKEQPVRILRTALNLQTSYNTSYRRVYHIMKEMVWSCTRGPNQEEM